MDKDIFIVIVRMCLIWGMNLTQKHFLSSIYKVDFHALTMEAAQASRCKGETGEVKITVCV